MNYVFTSAWIGPFAKFMAFKIMELVILVCWKESTREKNQRKNKLEEKYIFENQTEV